MALVLLQADLFIFHIPYFPQQGTIPHYLQGATGWPTAATTNRCQQLQYETSSLESCNELLGKKREKGKEITEGGKNKREKKRL